MAGTDIEEQEIDKREYARALHQVENSVIGRVTRVWLYNDFIFSKSSIGANYFDSVKKAHSLIDKIVQQRKEAIESRNGERSVVVQRNLLDMILQLENTKLAMEDIRDEINSLIIGGYDTSVMELTYVLIMLGSHPDVQERAFSEVQEIFRYSDEDKIDRRAVSRLKYLKAVIKETVRILPIITFIPRYLDRTVKLKNCTLAAGNNCILLVKALHRHPSWGADAEQYKPERWLDPVYAEKTSSVFAGFGLGKRNCIGKNYALMYLQVTLAHILRNYKVRANHRNLVHKLGVVLKPISGHYISLEKRM